MFLAPNPRLHEKPRNVCERAQVSLDLHVSMKDARMTCKKVMQH